MPRRGGVRQRLKSSKSELPQYFKQPNRKVATYTCGGRQRQTTLGKLFCSLFAVGRLSAPELQEGAEGHMTSCHGNKTDDKLCKQFNKAGHRGKHKGNAHRDIMRSLESKLKHKAPIYETKISLWDKCNQCRVWQWAHFLLPHEIFHFETLNCDLT